MSDISHKIASQLREQGFTVLRNKGSHTIWKHPDGRQCVTPTPNANGRGDHGWRFQLKAQLRKIGVEIDV